MPRPMPRSRPASPLATYREGAVYRSDADIPPGERAWEVYARTSVSYHEAIASGDPGSAGNFYLYVSARSARDAERMVLRYLADEGGEVLDVQEMFEPSPAPMARQWRAPVPSLGRRPQPRVMPAPMPHRSARRRFGGR